MYTPDFSYVYIFVISKYVLSVHDRFEISVDEKSEAVTAPLATIPSPNIIE